MPDGTVTLIVLVIVPLTDPPTCALNCKVPLPPGTKETDPLIELVVVTTFVTDGLDRMPVMVPKPAGRTSEKLAPTTAIEAALEKVML
jgi:hypothetical protein